MLGGVVLHQHIQVHLVEKLPDPNKRETPVPAGCAFAGSCLEVSLGKGTALPPTAHTHAYVTCFETHIPIV